jgi:hypothetical protein
MAGGKDSGRNSQGLFALGGHLDRVIWRAELSGPPSWRSAPIMALRMAAAIGRDLARGS